MLLPKAELLYCLDTGFAVFVVACFCLVEEHGANSVCCANIKYRIEQLAGIPPTGEYVVADLVVSRVALPRYKRDEDGKKGERFHVYKNLFRFLVWGLFLDENSLFLSRYPVCLGNNLMELGTEESQRKRVSGPYKFRVFS